MPTVYDPSLLNADTKVSHYYAPLKRLTDIIVSILMLIILSPVFVVIAIIIKLESRGPIIFKQWRYGYQGQKFLIYKFRTLNRDTLHATGGYQVGSKDDRMTRLGHILRAYSIDELPQLINVLKGNMSLVGPRPHAIDHHDHYIHLIPQYEARLEVLPGLTGLAQITGCRGATPELKHMYARFALDRLYIQRRSWHLDMKIIYLTLRYCAWHARPH